MHRREVVRLIIPSLFASSLLSCGEKNPSLSDSAMWHPAPSMSDKKMESNVRGILSGNKRLMFRWECGGDQAIVFLDDRLTDKEKPDLSNGSLYDSITLYIMNFLDLPDIGEFSMNGAGEFKVLEDETLVFEFESLLNSYVDYDPETKEPRVINVPKIDTSFSGTRIPFK